MRSVRGADRLDARDQLLRANQGFPPRLLILLVRGRIPRRKGGLRFGVALRDVRIVDHPGAEVVPFASNGRELLARCREILERGGTRGFLGELAQARAATFDVSPLRVAFLARADGALEAARQLVLQRSVSDRRHPLPFSRRDRELFQRLLTLHLLDALAQLEARTCLGVARLAGLTLRFRTLGFGERELCLAIRLGLSRARDLLGIDIWNHCSGGLGCDPGFVGGASLVHLAQHAARALRRRLVFCARGNLFQLGAIADPLNRGERGILEVAVQGDGQQLGVVVESLERRSSDRLVFRVPGDRPERVAVRHAFKRSKCGLFARSVLGDAAERLRIVDRRHACQAVARVQPFERFKRDITQHRERLCSHVLVGVGPGDAGERGRVHQFGDGGAPHTSVAVFACHFEQQIALVERELLHELQTGGRVRILVAGMSAESIKQCHTRSSLPSCVEVSL